MATEESVEIARDPSGLVTRTVTLKSFSDEDPSQDCRAYSKSHQDGVYTIKEEYYDDTSITVYSGDVSCSTEPIESHPEFGGLTEKQRRDWALWKQNPNDPLLNGWDPQTDENQNIVTLYNWYIGRNIQTYFAPRCVVKVSTIEESFPNLAGVGKISDPQETGNWPGNFILTGVSFQEEGSKYRVTREYLGSVAGLSWDIDVYSN
jgi:hypothetical protein